MVVVVHGGGREEGHEFQRRQVGAHDAVRVLIVERRPLRQRRTGRRSYRPHTHTHTHTVSVTGFATWGHNRDADRSAGRPTI